RDDDAQELDELVSLGDVLNGARGVHVDVRPRTLIVRLRLHVHNGRAAVGAPGRNLDAAGDRCGLVLTGIDGILPKVPAKRSWAVSLACRHDKQLGLCGLSARAGYVRYTGLLGADGDDVTTGVHERLQQGGIGDRRSSSAHE